MILKFVYFTRTSYSTHLPPTESRRLKFSDSSSSSYFWLSV